MSNVVEEIGKINFEGNRTPQSWFANIKTETGNTDLVAITLLAEICYWYTPTIIRDEHTGEVMGYKKKFKADKLQKSYEQLAKQFGLSKVQVRRAIKRLEQQGLITVEFRNIKVASGLAINNVMFIEPVPEKIAEITYRGYKSIDEEDGDKELSDVITSVSTPINFKVNMPLPKSTHDYTKKYTRPYANVDTNTEITTEITTENTTENIYTPIASENENEDLFEEETEDRKASKGKTKPVPYSEIVNLYNELCPSLPSVKQLTDKRRRKLKTLWEFVGGDIEQIRTVFENAEDSEFLSGRNEKWTGCNFDWLINTNNFVKVLEGSYNDRSGLRRMPGDDAFGIKAYLRREQEELERKSKNKDPAGIKAYLREHGYDSILADVEAKEREVAG